MEDFYKCLGVEPNAPQDVIKKAYRKLSLKHHPDRCGNDVVFKQINEAYQTLGDAQKRQMYDMQKSNPFGAMFSGAGMGGMGGGTGDTADMPDFLKAMIFGGLSGAMPGMAGAMPGGMDPLPINRQQSFGRMPHVQIFRNGMPINMNQMRKPTPIIKTIEITLEQAYTGMKFPLEIERWVQENNTKRVEKERLYVDIPAGIDNNEIIIMRDRGNILAEDCRGDIKLFIKIINNSRHLVRHGMDLVFQKNITLKEALCGFAFDIEHINGKIYTINNNTGKIITPQFQKMVPGMGMTRGEVGGNLIINFKIKFPEDLTDEQRTKLGEIL
jgi:DnaJ-class molecular chaperone